jgi:hypothetical protein
LLLIVAADDSPQHESIFVDLEPQILSREIRASGQRRFHNFSQFGPANLLCILDFAAHGVFIPVG